MTEACPQRYVLVRISCASNRQSVAARCRHGLQSYRGKIWNQILELIVPNTRTAALASNAAVHTRRRLRIMNRPAASLGSGRRYPQYLPRRRATVAAVEGQ